ncbi:MAG: CarD family transcriptional regulator [Acidobacteria bacterium]|nr:CarD family transcriptional regulator [Acidobacteriota bacterium]
MELSIGQKVTYPTQGVCVVEDIKRRDGSSLSYYYLRVLSDNSIIFVPVANAETVGLRPVISAREYRKLVDFLGRDFDEVSHDWKIRSREFALKLQSGDVFETADVLKKLTFLSHEKKLSFREQSFLEKARFLIVSEVTNASLATEKTIARKLDELVERACVKHQAIQPCVLAATVH